MTVHATEYRISRAQRRILHARLPLHRQVVQRAVLMFIPAQVVYSSPTDIHGFPFLSSCYNHNFFGFTYMRVLIGAHTHARTHAHAGAHTQNI
jgi:hypothetical protein